MDNSLDACEESRILPEIRVEIQRLKGWLRLITQDNGPGIPREDIENVFGNSFSDQDSMQLGRLGVSKE